MPKDSTRSISTCRQFMIIYEEVIRVVLVWKATIFTSFGSSPMQVPMCRSFNFLRRTISLCKSSGWFITCVFSVWIFGQKGRTHLTNSAKCKWRCLKWKDEQFDYFGYQQELATNVTIANCEPNPGSVSKTFQTNFLKFWIFFFKRIMLTKEPSTINPDQFWFDTVSWAQSLSHLFASQWINISDF